MHTHNETIAHPYNHSRWEGRPISFDHPIGGASAARLVGITEKAVWKGYTERGHIPDWTLTVRGKSGKVLEISLVESKVSFRDCL